MAFEDIKLLDFDVTTSRRERTESERVRELQRYLDDDDEVDDELLAAMVEELDEGCDYIGQPVPIHGVVEIAYQDIDSAETAIMRRDMQGEALIAQGFGVYSRPQSDGTMRPTVGHFFTSPQPKIPLSSSNLAYDLRGYMAFAPYGSIDVEYQRSGVELAEHLDVIVPDLIAEIDDRVYSSGSTFEALQNLTDLSYTYDNIPSESLSELVTYVNEILDLESLGLLKFSLRGVYSDADDPVDSTTYRVYDRHAPDGGQIEAIGRIESVFLAPHLNYVAGKHFVSEQCYWKVTLAIEASTLEDNRLDDCRIDLTLSDMTDVQNIDLTNLKL